MQVRKNQNKHDRKREHNQEKLNPNNSSGIKAYARRQQDSNCYKGKKKQKKRNEAAAQNEEASSWRARKEQ